MSPLSQSIIAHLWESTLFGIVCCLLLFALRKSSSSLRHLIAWASLTKFLIPFSLFSSIGVWFRNALPSADSNKDGVGPYVDLLTQKIQIDTWMPFQADGPIQATTIPGESIGLAIWIMGIVALHLFWIKQYWRVKTSINTECSEASIGWQSLAIRIWEKSPDARPRIMICHNANLLAGLFGFLRPQVIIPASFDTDFNEAEKEAFLRHEFQHLYKKDNLWLLAQTLIRNLFWIHPLAWWSNHQVSVEREIMRDDEVIQKTKSASSYLKCLLKASTTQLPSSYATSLGIKGAPFKKRVEAIGNGKASIFMNTLSAIGSIAGISALTLVLSMSASQGEKLRELRSDIQKMDHDLDQKVSELQAQVDIESQKREEILSDITKIKQAEEASNSAQDPAKPPKIAETEPQKKRLTPVLLDKEKPLYKELLRLIKENKDQEALDLIFKSIDQDSSGALYFMAGGFLAKKNEIEKAADFFETAVDKFPDFLRAARNAGMLRAQLGEYEKSKTHLLKAHSLGALDTATKGVLGLSYLNTGDPVSAEHHYRSAIELDSDIRDWWEGLAKSLIEQGKNLESEAIAAQIKEKFGP